MKKDDHKMRLAMQNELRSRIQDLIDDNPSVMIGELTSLSVALLAEAYPTKLSDEDKSKIKVNYPEANDALMAERSMSENGLKHAVSAAVLLARIPIDYSPLSYCMDDIEKDKALNNDAHDVLTEELQTAFVKAVSNGMSPFGVATTMIHIGAMSAIRSNVKWPVITRTLLEAIEHNMNRTSAGVFEEEKEAAIQMIMGQLGISRKTALQYFEIAMKKKSGGLS